ncbi:MAG TPA: hypothetical protein VLE25_13605, partial [Nitrospira sp.]|nr:hypothetical protein [Nitrospira sp.]
MESLTTAHIAFFASLALLAYSYLGYPAMLWLLTRVRRHHLAAISDPAVWPEVSIVIAAHNE